MNVFQLHRGPKTTDMATSTAAVMAAFHSADDVGHPARWLDDLAAAAGAELASAAFAAAVDEVDPLKECRSKFHVSGAKMFSA